MPCLIGFPLGIGGMFGERLGNGCVTDLFEASVKESIIIIID